MNNYTVIGIIAAVVIVAAFNIIKGYYDPQEGY